MSFESHNRLVRVSVPVRWLRLLSALLAALLLIQTCAAQSKAAKSSGKSKEKDPNELPVEEPVNLLAMIKLPEHNLRGTWKRQDQTLICEPGDCPTVMAPVAVRGNYAIDYEFTRRTAGDGTSLLLPIGLTSVQINLGGWGGAVHGLGLINNTESRSLPESSGAVVRPGIIVNGQRHHVHVDVQQQSGRVTVQATLNGRTFVAWRGSFAQLSTSWVSVLPHPQAVGVLCNASVFDIHRLELTIGKNGQGYRLKDDWKNPLTIVSDQPPRQIAAQCATWNGRRYYLSDRPVNFATAQRLAAAYNGRLLTISTAEEEAFILKEGRGVGIWMSGWRYSGSDVWRDERNRPLRFHPRWGPGNPNLSYHETCLILNTTTGFDRGCHDTYPHDPPFHACIEWGEEYPAP